MIAGGILGRPGRPGPFRTASQTDTFYKSALAGATLGLAAYRFCPRDSWLLLVAGFVRVFFLLSIGPTDFQMPLILPTRLGKAPRTPAAMMGQISGILFIFGNGQLQISTDRFDDTFPGRK